MSVFHILILSHPLFIPHDDHPPPSSRSSILYLLPVIASKPEAALINETLSH